MLLLEVLSSLSVLRKLINWLRRWPLTRAGMRSALRPAPARFTGFPFDNCQQGGMGQNINISEPSLKDIVRDQLMIYSEVGKKLLANDRILESIDSKMNNFTVAV
jgi:hypothetical protein